MLNRRMRFTAISLAMSLAIMSFATGCGALKKPAETEPQTQSETESETETETESETEPETELQTNVPYASKDGSIRITLPDSTWKVSQDADSLRVFSSGADAMISIVHAADESAMRNLTVSESKEELSESLTNQYPDTNAFEVVEFEKQSTSTLDTYEYVVKYNSTSMWTYSVTYAIMAEKEAYMVTGTVTDDNTALLTAVRKAVESFTVLRNATFSAIPGKVTNQTGQTDQSETVQSQSASDANAQAELNTLTKYGTNATLYASDTVNIRMEPTTASDTNIIGSLTKGDQVTVIGETSQWFQISINGNIGYVNKAFLVNTQPQSETTEQSETEASGSSMTQAELNSYVDYGTSYEYYATTGANLRDQPGTAGNIIGGVYAGQPVSIIGETDNWFVVSVNGAKAYVSKSYITSTNPGGSTGDEGNNGSTGGNNSGSTGGNTGGNTGGGTGTLGGTIVGTTPSTITIQGDDGNTYVVNYQDASVSTNEGLQDGLYVSVTVDYGNTAPNGELYATNVTGY